MVVLSTLDPPLGNIWYLAYGSNLSYSKFVNDRGMTPLKTAVVLVPGFTLAMESAGIPYREPSFATIRPLAENSYPQEKELLGTAYLLTKEQYGHLIASEGGGIAYEERYVDARHVEPPNLQVGAAYGHGMLVARTLISVIMRSPAPRPSQRYMNLILDGASETKYPEHYQEFLRGIEVYHPPHHRRGRIGASIFLALWVPVMTLMEQITKASIDWRGNEDGSAPSFVIWLVRSVVATMWWYHDYVHAPWWGRGDGLDQSGEVKLSLSY